jgi:hypothetical protein
VNCLGLLACLALALALAAGCASDPRYQQGLEWVQWIEQEKKRLEAEGFPQYTGGGER